MNCPYYLLCIAPLVLKSKVRQLDPERLTWMDRERETQRAREGKYTSTKKPLRTVSLAILFHTYWPKRLTRDELVQHLAPFYGTTAIPALYRDLQTLTATPLEPLPHPAHP